MASDVRVWDGTKWESIMGPPGPIRVSADAGNCSRLGGDGLVYTPALPLAGGTITGPVVMEGGSANFTIQSTAGQFNVINRNASTGVVGAQYRIQSQANGNFRIFDITASADRLRILPSGDIEIPGGLKVGPNTLPAATGTANQVLSTNGAGVLSWRDEITGPTGNFLPLTGGTVTGTLTVNNLTNCLNGFAANGNIFPADKGTSGQVLSTNGAGVLSWVTPTTGAFLPLAGGTVTGNTAFSARIDSNGAFVHGGSIYPTTRGTNGQVLTTNGAGTLSWQDAAGGPGGAFLPLAGGTLTGDLAVDRSAAATVGTVTVKGTAAVLELAETTTGANWRIPANAAGELRINKTGATPATRATFTGTDATFVERTINSTALGPAQFSTLSGTRPVALSDVGKIVLCDASAGDCNLFLGSDATIPVGSVFEVINPTSAKVQFFNDASVFMFFNVGNAQFGSVNASVFLSGRNTGARVIKTASNTWMIFGDLANASVRDGGSTRSEDIDAAAAAMVAGAMEAQAKHDARYAAAMEPDA